MGANLNLQDSTFTMKTADKTLKVLSFASILAASSLLGFVHGAEEPEPCSTIALSRSDCGTSSCVMVFARVGERFQFDLQVSDHLSTDCVVGVNATGESSSLPAGLAFNAEEASLEGVPLRAGFHEFVVLQTEKGMTREQVVLIDIQEHSFGSGGVDYASYVAGGLH